MTKKSSIQRPYPPDLLDIETLAYRLCMNKRTVHSYVLKGWLPPPIKIGNLTRWNWNDILNHIAQKQKIEQNKEESDDVDEYIQGINNVAPAKKRDDRVA